MPLVKETKEFRDAIAFFVNRGMVREETVVIHPLVVDAIIEGHESKKEYLETYQNTVPSRIMGKVFTSVPFDLQIVDLEYQKQVEFARSAASFAARSQDGDKVLAAVDQAFESEPLDLSKVESELKDLLASLPSESGGSTLTVEDIKGDSDERATVSSTVAIEYVVPMNVNGSGQLRDLRMTFAARSVFAGGRNYPLDSAVNLIRPTTYELANNILGHLPFFNLPMFCPFASLVLTRDQHRAAVSSFNLIREAVFLWVAHAIEITKIPRNTDDVDKEQAHALKTYKKVVKAITRMMQPCGESFRTRFKALKGDFDANAKEFYQMVKDFTIQVTYLMWECVIGMYEFPIGGGLPQILGLCTSMFPSAMHFTPKELETMQDHHSGMLGTHASELESDDTLVRTAFPDLFVQGESDHDVPLIQDGVDAFLTASMTINTQLPPAFPSTTMGELRDLWLYCVDLVKAKQPVWLDAFSDSMGKIE